MASRISVFFYESIAETNHPAMVRLPLRQHFFHFMILNFRFSFRILFLPLWLSNQLLANTG